MTYTLDRLGFYFETKELRGCGISWHVLVQPSLVGLSGMAAHTVSQLFTCAGPPYEVLTLQILSRHHFLWQHVVHLEGHWVRVGDAQKGVIWRIENITSGCIWKDPWLPIHTPTYLSLRAYDACLNGCLSSWTLMKVRTRSWFANISGRQTLASSSRLRLRAARSGLHCLAPRKARCILCLERLF